MRPRASRRCCATLRRSGVAVLLIEHDMSLVMNVADRVAVLDFGKDRRGNADETVQLNPDVIAAYLGTAEAPMLELVVPILVERRRRSAASTGWSASASASSTMPAAS